MQFEENHKKIIQDHYRNPRHKKPLTENELDSVKDNPLLRRPGGPSDSGREGSCKRTQL